MPKKDTSGTEQAFEREEKYLKAQLLRARDDHNRRLEAIQLSKLGTLYRKNKAFDRAIDHYRKVLAIDKENSFALDGLGMSYFQQGDYGRAIEWFDKQLNPVVAMNNLCRAYRHKGEYREAIGFARRVLDKDPEDVIAMNELGILHRLLGEYDESIGWFGRCLELRPNDKQALDGLGITCREMGDFDVSIGWFEKKLRHYPNDKQALDGLGITCREKGDFDAAIGCFQRLLRLEPNSKHALDGLGITCRAQGDYAAAIGWFQKKLQHYPNDKQALDGLGITCRERGNFDAAIDWFERKLRHYPNDKEALDGLGITCREQGNYGAAIGWFEKKLKLHPNDAYARRGLTATYRRMGAAPKAVQLLKQHLYGAPGDRVAREQLEIISREYEKQEKTQEALEIAEFLRETGRVTSAPEKVSLPETQTMPDFHPEKGKQEPSENRIQRLQKQLDEQAAALVRSRQRDSLGVMASGLAHEIMQPVQTVLLAAENCRASAAEQGLDAPFLDRSLDRIARMAKRIDHIVNHLHVLSRERKPRREPLALDAVVADVFSLFDQQLKSRGIRVEQKITEDLPPVFMDRVQLEQVFINLISNARDALEQSGRGEKIITVRAEARGAALEAVFADTGAGIAPENAPRVFEPFFTTKEKGVGLGLHIVQEILREYDGAIRAGGLPDGGAVFTFDLPLYQGGDTPKQEEAL
ncbi:MAG: Tetratricopeptide repeat-containing protein [Candidatus Kentron sp. G]|nr:MAG: Tetratricopeptide repeat-containing protein [Candidatus Kentron sp. G]VFM95735.1 MAG: Tetratricopeptide repeat-containing protein [Candidatus Kentron sp. G]VFM97513.1 MAG: Tetratricopeptide repeat-containing protein [Candidatus Kentron sp. G]